MLFKLINGWNMSCATYSSGNNNEGCYFPTAGLNIVEERLVFIKFSSDFVFRIAVISVSEFKKLDCEGCINNVRWVT
jgi:hypothetical protein